MGLDNEDIKALIAILQKGLASETEEAAPKTKKAKITKNKQSKSSNKNNNKFDSMPESKLHKEDVLIDQKLRRSAPTPRRDAFQPIKVSCRVCHKTDMVDPSIIESIDRYKCNKCSVSAG
jgi:hypothetical protein